jgi:ribosomal protein L23
VISKRDRRISGHAAPPCGRLYQSLVSDKQSDKKKAYVMLEDGQTIDVTTGL